MIHRPISKHLFTLEGSVRTSGGAKNLAKGEFTIVNVGKAGVNGATVVGDFAGLPDSTVFEMRLGKHDIPTTRTAANAKPLSSQTFTIKDVVSIRANFPKVTVQKFDDLLVGYDGVNDATAITLNEGQTTLMDITLSGEPIEFLTGEKQYVVKKHFGKEVGENDQDVIERLVKDLKATTLPMNVPLTTLLDIKTINSERAPLSGIPYVFSHLQLTDDGSSNAKALVQAQYPTYKVQRTNRDGLVSTYTILRPSTASLAAFSQSIPAYLKDCASCDSGYTAITQGFVYSVQIEDDGADLSTTVDNLPGTVVGSVTKKGQKDGVGTYTVVTDDAVTDAEIATYVGTAGAQSTARITLLGEVREVCSDTTTTTTAWTSGDTCYATVKNYKIQLANDPCDGSRLTELQAQYPDLTIETGVPTGNARQTATITGSSGNMVLVINGTSYTTAYNTSTTQTVADFITDHKAAIEAAVNVTVTGATNVVTIVGSAEGFPVVTAGAGGLTETISTLDYLTTASATACQGVYSTQVLTNVVCDECDPIFVQGFTSTAPQPFDMSEWELVPVSTSADAKMGIRLTGKPYIFKPTDITRDEIPFIESSVSIRVSGGYIENVNESFQPIYANIFNVKRLSRKQDRDNLGYHLLGHEEASRAYFDGTVRHKGNLYAKAVLGEDSVLKFDKQYVQYAIAIKDTKYSQGMGSTSNMTTEYSVWAEFGREKNLEAYVNKLAAKAGLPAVQIAAEDLS